VWLNGEADRWLYVARSIEKPPVVWVTLFKCMRAAW
jgi:hypothetical protein